MVRHVTLVYGPPCGGKTTHVHENKAPGDIVLDFDDIARECGSPHQWRHNTQIAAVAEQVMRTRMIALKTQPNVHAWVIRTAPTEANRREAMTLCGATHIVDCVPPMAETLARARLDRRPPGTDKAIRRWYAMNGSNRTNRDF